MIEAAWGSNTGFGDGVSYEFIRSEGISFPSNRCLVPASEFHIRNGEKKFRAFREDGNFFYLAPIWEPAMGDRPVSYRILTVDANPDVIRYQPTWRDHRAAAGYAMAGFHRARGGSAGKAAV